MSTVRVEAVCLRDCRLNNLGSRAGKLTGWECGQARHALVCHSTATCGASPALLRPSAYPSSQISTLPLHHCSKKAAALTLELILRPERI